MLEGVLVAKTSWPTILGTAAAVIAILSFFGGIAYRYFLTPWIDRRIAAAQSGDDTQLPVGIETSEAVLLWNENKDIRRELRAENEQLRQEVSALRAQIVEQQAQISDLRLRLVAAGGRWE